MDALDKEALVYLVGIVLVIINATLWDRIAVMKDRIETLERQMRELHRIVVQNLPNEE